MTNIGGSGLSLHNNDRLDTSRFIGRNVLGTLIMQVRDKLLVTVEIPSPEAPPNKKLIIMINDASSPDGPSS